MNRIWKTTLRDDEDEQTVTMPKGAKPLSVQVQKGEIALWFLCDEAAEPVARRVKSFGTGHGLEGSPGDFLGTVQLIGGDFVLHYFIEPEA